MVKIGVGDWARELQMPLLTSVTINRVLNPQQHTLFPASSSKSIIGFENASKANFWECFHQVLQLLLYKQGEINVTLFVRVAWKCCSHCAQELGHCKCIWCKPCPFYRS